MLNAPDGQVHVDASTIMPTVTRMPRMQGFPPITSGLVEMRGSFCNGFRIAGTAGGTYACLWDTKGPDERSRGGSYCGTLE